jgi:hypothetical protein
MRNKAELKWDKVVVNSLCFSFFNFIYSLHVNGPLGGPTIVNIFLYKYTNTRMSSLVVCFTRFIKVVSCLQCMAEETSCVFLKLGSIVEESFIYISITFLFC